MIKNRSAQNLKDASGEKGKKVGAGLTVTTAQTSSDTLRTIEAQLALNAAQSRRSVEAVFLRGRAEPSSCSLNEAVFIGFLVSWLCESLTSEPAASLKAF